MRSSAIATAIAWQVWSRHRLGLPIALGCLILMILLFPPILLRFESFSVFTVTVGLAALTSAFIVNAVIFTDEAGNMDSGYPRRMYVLPVTTGTLAFWPLLIAIFTVVTLWLAIAGLIYYRGGYRPPLAVTAVALAVCVAWIQTACWLPVKSPLLRVYVLLLGFWALIGTPGWLWWIETVSSTQLQVLGGIELIALYVLARLSLAHDRRGDDWSLGVERLGDWCWSILDRSSRQPSRLAGPAAAQDWYEARCHDPMLSGVMILMQIIMAAMYLWIPADKQFAHRIGLAAVLTMPVMMAGSQGSSLGRMRPLRTKQRGFITFIAVRPIMIGELVAAKYRLVTRHVGFIWLMTIAAATALVLVKGQASDVAGLLRSFLQAHPGWRGWTTLGLVIVLVPIYTWKLLTDHLAAVLSGRRWLADGSVFLGTLILLALIGATGWYVEHVDLLPRHLAIGVWVLAFLVIVKCVVALVGFSAALGRGLIDMRSVLGVLAFLTVAAVATLLLADLLIPAGSLAVPRPVALLSTLIMLPTARFALAPLALDWNRHR
jgi:hypothetical protein